MKRDEKKVWSRLARVYDKIINKDKKAYSKVIQIIKKDSQPSDKVLEIGTATGVISFALSDYFKEIEAIDFSNNMIEVAKCKAKDKGIYNINFDVGDACNLNYDDNVFDRIIIANVLHIMPEPAKALEQIKRVLGKDGVLYAPTFVHANVKKAGIFSFVGSIVGFKAYSKWTEADYHDFIKSNGFIIDNSMMLEGASFPMSFIACRVNR